MTRVAALYVEKRTGIVQALSKRQRAATPPEFRDLLLGIAASARPAIMEAAE